MRVLRNLLQDDRFTFSFIGPSIAVMVFLFSLSPCDLTLRKPAS